MAKRNSIWIVRDFINNFFILFLRFCPCEDQCVFYMQSYLKVKINWGKNQNKTSYDMAKRKNLVWFIIQFETDQHEQWTCHSVAAESAAFILVDFVHFICAVQFEWWQHEQRWAIEWRTWLRFKHWQILWLVSLFSSLSLLWCLVNFDFIPFIYCIIHAIDLIDFHFHTIAGFKYCESYRSLNASHSKFIELKYIENSSSIYHNARLTIFVRGVSDCHIVLSRVASPNRDKELFYDFGKWSDCEQVWTNERQKKCDAQQSVWIFFFFVIFFFGRLIVLFVCSLIGDSLDAIRS